MSAHGQMNTLDAPSRQAGSGSGKESHGTGSAKEPLANNPGESEGATSGGKARRTRNRNYTEPGKYRGVRFRGQGKYSAELKVGSVRKWLGTFPTAEDAARAFDVAAYQVRVMKAPKEEKILAWRNAVRGQGAEASVKLANPFGG